MVGPESNPTTADALIRRERVLAKVLVLMALLRLGRFGRQRKAFQRALGVSDEVLLAVQHDLQDCFAWGITSA